MTDEADARIYPVTGAIRRALSTLLPQFAAIESSVGALDCHREDDGSLRILRAGAVALSEMVATLEEGGHATSLEELRRDDVPPGYVFVLVSVDDRELFAQHVRPFIIGAVGNA